MVLLEVEVERAEEVEFVGSVDGVVLLLVPLRYDGGGTAVDASTSAPIPQGVFSPSGCAAFGGGMVAPVESAIANRPVHVLAETFGAVNW